MLPTCKILAMIHHPHLKGDAFSWSSGPVGVLLTHGFTATTAEIRPLARNLYQEGYTVAGPLLPGHGTQPEDLNRVNWRDWVNAAQDVYLHLDQHCDHVFVGGESTGALVALYLASQNFSISGILTYAPAIKLNYNQFQHIILRLASSFIPYKEKMDWVPNLLWQGYGVLPLKGALQLINFQTEIRKRLPEIDQPILIVQGRQDATVHPDGPEIISHAVSSSQKDIHWMEQSGHVVILDKELDQVTQITLNFLQRVLSASPNN